MTSPTDNRHESHPRLNLLVAAVALSALLARSVMAAPEPGETPPAKPGAATHAEMLGEPYLRANAKDLKHTIVVPTLGASLPADTNVVWCATFQIAWNELCTLAGEDLRMEREDPIVALLNRKEVTRKNLDPTTYFATAGIVGDGVVKVIADGLQRQFKGAASPELTAGLEDLPADAVVAYAYLFADLPFVWTFDRLEEPLRFGEAEVEVKAFGIDRERTTPEKRQGMAGQVRIHVLDEHRGVIIELRTRLPNHRLILAKVRPLATLSATVKSVMDQARQSKPRAMPEEGDIQIPLLNFDLTREYTELTERNLQVRKPPLAGTPIVRATQQIRFKLGEGGAILKSEAVIPVPPGVSVGPTLIFNQPFLILLQVAGSDKPYFAAWIAHPELLVKF